MATIGKWKAGVGSLDKSCKSNNYSYADITEEILCRAHIELHHLRAGNSMEGLVDGATCQQKNKLTTYLDGGPLTSTAHITEELNGHFSDAAVTYLILAQIVW